MLTDNDIDLLKNAAFIHQKNKIIDEIVLTCSKLLEEYKSKATAYGLIKLNTFDTNGKIAKGEKLDGMPWVMLDYPRNFNEKIGFLAIRTLFWWGNFAKVELLLSGKYKDQWAPIFLNDKLAEIGFTNDPWIHDKGTLVNNASLNYFKLIYYEPFDQLETLSQRLSLHFDNIISKLKE